MAVKYTYFINIKLLVLLLVMPDLQSSREMLRLKRKLSVELLWIYLLSILKEKPLHAYALRKSVSEQFGFLPGNVSAYVVLYNLESRGFVSTRKDENRVVYTITEKGRSLLLAAEKELRGMIGKLF